MKKLEDFEFLNNNFSSFEIFKTLILEEGKKFNITSIFDEEDILIKHFFDSIFCQKFLKENAKIIEVGSGGGFPSVPLKIERGDLNFTLIEATNKKCNFLNLVKERLGFQNFSVFNMRAEDAGKSEEFREKFDYSIARAVAPLNILLEYLLPLVKVGGYAVCLKGSSFEEEINNAKNAFNVLGGEIETVETYALPKDKGERAVIMVKKVKSTPNKYPRGQGKERKCPL